MSGPKTDDGVKFSILDMIVKYWVLIFFLGTLFVNAVRSEMKLNAKLDREEARELIMEALRAHEATQKEMSTKVDQVPVIQEQLRQIDGKVDQQTDRINEIYRYLLKK